MNSAFDQFDRVVINMNLNDKARKENVDKQLAKLSLTDQPNLIIHENAYMPFNIFAGKQCGLDPQKDTWLNEKRIGTVFSCAYNHLSIIANAYAAGCEKILIFEDDLLFNKPEIVNNTIKDLPEDFDVIKFYWSVFRNKPKHKVLQNPNNDKFIKLDKSLYRQYMCSALCYALNRKGMEAFLNITKDKFVIFDLIFGELDESINFYVYYENDMLLNTPYYEDTKIHSTIMI